MDYLSYLYTPQQMSGGASFGHSTRVGNWSEDYELQQHRIKVRRCFSLIPLVAMPAPLSCRAAQLRTTRLTCDADRCNL